MNFSRTDSWSGGQRSPLARLPGMTTAVRSYVGTGGSLFVVSTSTRLTEIPGETNFIRDIPSREGFPGGPGRDRVVRRPRRQAEPDWKPPSTSTPSRADSSWTCCSSSTDSQAGTCPTITPAADAAPVFLQESQRVVGLRYPRTGQDTAGDAWSSTRFPFEASALDTPAPDNRPTCSPMRCDS